METINSVIARARHHCEVHGVAWTPAQESVIRNVVAPLMMDMEALQTVIRCHDEGACTGWRHPRTFREEADVIICNPLPEVLR